LIARTNRVQAAHGRSVWIDAFVLEDQSIDEFLACKIAVGVGDKIAV
jgi:hypothetical protein